MEHPLLNEGVGRLTSVILKFAIAPAADPHHCIVVVEPVAGIEIPLGFVDLLAVEFVAPHLLPLSRGGLCGLVLWESSEYDGEPDD